MPTISPAADATSRAADPTRGVPGPALTEPVEIAGRTAPSRVMFGPHETNLARRREIGARHLAYYLRRAAGGAGVLVTETASVTSDDWPYERAPLATDCGPGWAALAAAARPYGTMLLAGLGHAGGQGSSAYSQHVLWAPSPFADAGSRELPAEMEQPQIDEVVAGFAAAARIALDAGLAGVEIDAGPFGLLRQFASGLTNLRGDAYGTDRLRFTREVLRAVRAAVGSDAVLGLRMSCDELAPWAGVTPDQAATQVDALADLVDLLVVTRGGPFSTTSYRPTGHTGPTFNLDLCRAMRTAAAGRVPVVLQGSVVDVEAATRAIDDGTADLVEMTRAQIAEPGLVGLVRTGRADQVRPCVLCNQTCRVRDNRNPIVSCIGEPRAGHETEEPDADGTDLVSREVLVVGGGTAGLEAARVLAARGHRVRLAESGDVLGGTLRAAAVLPGRERFGLLVDWLESECRRLGVAIDLGVHIGPADLDAARADGRSVVLATGSRPAPRRYAPLADGVDAADPAGLPAFDGPPAADGVPSLDAPGTAAGAAGPDAAAIATPATTAGVAAATPTAGATASRDAGGTPDAAAEPVGTPGADASAGARADAGWTTVLDVLDVLKSNPGDLPPGAVAIHDPIGGPVGVGVAEWLARAGRRVVLVTPDQVAGTLLSLTGDLAPANTRLAQAGVRRELRSLIREVGAGRIVLEDIWTGTRRGIDCAVLIDAGHRLPEESLYLSRPGTPRAGDCIAPRTSLEAVLEGRRRALEVGTGAASPDAGPPRPGTADPGTTPPRASTTTPPAGTTPPRATPAGGLRTGAAPADATHPAAPARP